MDHNLCMKMAEAKQYDTQRVDAIVEVLKTFTDHPVTAKDIWHCVKKTNLFQNDVEVERVLYSDQTKFARAREPYRPVGYLDVTHEDKWVLTKTALPAQPVAWFEPDARFRGFRYKGWDIVGRDIQALHHDGARRVCVFVRGQPQPIHVDFDTKDQATSFCEQARLPNS